MNKEKGEEQAAARRLRQKVLAVGKAPGFGGQFGGAVLPVVPRHTGVGFLRALPGSRADGPNGPGTRRLVGVAPAAARRAT